MIDSTPPARLRQNSSAFRAPGKRPRADDRDVEVVVHHRHSSAEFFAVDLLTSCGSGSALRSALPLGVSGISSIFSKRLGIM